MNIEEMSDEEITQAAKDVGYADKPKEDWQGDPDKWVDAKTFLERSLTYVPFLKKSNDKLSSQIDTLQGQMVEIVAGQQRQLDDREKESYNKARQDLIDEQKAAISDGDADKFAASQEAIDKLKEPKPTVKTEDPAVAAFRTANPEYFSDFEKNTKMEQYGNFLLKNNTYASPGEYLNVLSKYMEELYKPKSKVMELDEGGSPPSGTKPGKVQSFNSLPQGAKDGFEQSVHMGIFKDDKESRDKYAKTYFNPIEARN
ncbi:MAG: hypothetical protein QQN63_09125 [Nitrosopumilus sp.]